MKQIFIENYIGKPLEHEYNLDNYTLDNQTEFKLFNSIDGCLTSKLVDDGNKIELISSKGNILTLSYYDAQRILILLIEHNNTKIEFREFITLKTI